MNVLKKLEIPFKGLLIGEHEYDFTISDSFFEAIEYSDIKHGDLSVHINLDKQSGMIVLNFSIQGAVTLPCDRCLEDFSFPIDAHEILIVKFGPERLEESDEVIVLPETDHSLQLWSFIYEYISLQIPYRKVHPDDENGNSTCNQELIEKIDQISKSNHSDPRWDALKDIKFD